MASEQTAAAAGQATERSDQALSQFLTQSAAAHKAAASLKKAAEVGVHFTDVPGDFRFYSQDGQPRFEKVAAKDPDFEITLPPSAVKELVRDGGADVGDLGVAFFLLVVAKEPERKVQLKLHSGLMKLTMRGYLGVLAAGGPKVLGWLGSKGLKGPGAVAGALSRLKNG